MKTVLLVEDSADVREAIRMILGDEFHLLEAGSAEEGLKLVPLSDIIILDMRLPGMSGGEFLEKVYGRNSEVKIPVVIFTGIMSREEAIDLYATRYPVVECFTKPGDPEELIRVLRQTNGVHLMKIDAATRVIKKFVEKQSITDTQWWKGVR